MEIIILYYNQGIEIKKKVNESIFEWLRIRFAINK